MTDVLIDVSPQFSHPPGAAARERPRECKRKCDEDRQSENGAPAAAMVSKKMIIVSNAFIFYQAF